MGVLINVTIRDAEYGFFMDDKYNGLPYFAGTPNSDLIRLYSTSGIQAPIDLDLNTVTIQNRDGADVTPTDTQKKAELIALYLGQTIDLAADTISPFPVNNDEVTINDVDWDASDFPPEWEGNPRDLLGNVNNGGLVNSSTDNPKYFILRLKRTKELKRKKAKRKLFLQRLLYISVIVGLLVILAIYGTH